MESRDRPGGPESLFREPSSSRFYLAFLVGVAGGAVLAFGELFASALHSLAITVATALLGGVLIVFAVAATWRRLS